MAEKKLAGRTKPILAMLILFGPAFLLVLIGTRKCEHKFKVLDDYGKAIEYSFTDVNGDTLTANDFKDKIVLVTTLQKTCPEDCAISFWHIDQKIYQGIRKDTKRLADVILISFVTDGKGNPISDLAPVQDMLEDEVEDYNPDIWVLASGDARALYNFEHNGQTLLQKGDEYHGGEAFQELMLLLDKENDLRMVLSGKTEGVIRRMFEHIALLKKEYDKEKKNEE